ncbi:unnamed protein product [Brachionus calyciflorus]|uniref:YHYH domain-containing protein n=1 Tax=Brachionus calyciflorus TaxID=104777 RepID=A0A813TGX3_9BILA|nr:unnamed protein product [Brachionus calyciflorus]
MKSLIFLGLIIWLLKVVNGQVYPIITKWVKSNGTGYANAKTNVYKITYTSDYVYVSTNSIPTFSIGPWASNPNDAKGQSFTFRLPINPSYSSTKVEVPLGHIGLWLNGVSVYNADDGMTYNNKGVWKRNAYVFEGVSFDACKGHPDGSSEYHQHISSSCLYNNTANYHSPLIGFAFDGYPIYGPYGYSSATDTSSAIKRLTTSYKTRSITDRTTLSNGTVLTADLQGPTLAEYALGSYLQDYEYSAGYGDLDEYNGRYCKTPEYPSGTYAYFVATDSSLTPVYPFVVGPYYRGVVESANFGTGSGKFTSSGTVYYEYSAANLNIFNVFTLIIVLLATRLF